MGCFKCRENKKAVGDSDAIFNSDIKDSPGAEFKGKVSLLEPDVSQMSCSIMISDITLILEAITITRLGTENQMHVHTMRKGLLFPSQI
ncbi:hypothetical protein AMECASPLE_038698 [Ameca splendens]|uniref:Uncharacterized protein n=1 Tax=Ameca splendens TaxID=208324 RepID=A0ABV1AEM7_9TELE